MAEELADLPADSVVHAIIAWRRGDNSHLSSYEQDRARIGTFFPKPAELREIAQFHVREERRKAKAIADAEEGQRQEEHRKAHPEEYCSWGDILQDVKERARVKLLEPERKPTAPSTSCPHCGGAIVTTVINFTPADLRTMADVREKQLRLQAEAPQESSVFG